MMVNNSSVKSPINDRFTNGLHFLKKIQYFVQCSRCVGYWYLSDQNKCQVACPSISRKVNLCVGFQKTFVRGLSTKVVLKIR